MSLENNLKRIADSLELIATSLDNLSAGALAAPAPNGTYVNENGDNCSKVDATNTPGAAPAPPAGQEASTAATSTGAQTAPPPPAQEASAAPAALEVTAILSAEEMNNALVAEFKRLGSREPIDQAMANLGVSSVVDLPADKQQELLAAVRAIQS
jgi:hypothetical protein